MYLVNGNEEDYELLLKNRGTDEAKLREEAREMVKKDLVYYYIVRNENITVTDAEKAELFEKYVEKYVTAYGYNRDYVVGNMTGIIYDSMLYDKTMEFLINNNIFEVAVESSEAEN
jgi:FKBP-type peptidyl-prolyl cis-trans isomerase (trigger factor)